MAWLSCFASSQQAGSMRGSSTGPVNMRCCCCWCSDRSQCRRKATSRPLLLQVIAAEIVPEKWPAGVDFTDACNAQ